MRIPRDFSYGAFYKSSGETGSGELLGAGFMEKPIAKADHIDFDQPQYSLCLVLEGKGEYHDHTGKIWPLYKGRYFQRIPGLPHSNYIIESGSWIECFVTVGPHLCESLKIMGVIDPQVPCGDVLDLEERMNDAAQLRREFERFYGRALLPLLPDVIGFLTRVMLGPKRQLSDPAGTFLDEAKQMLEQSLHEEIDIVSLCADKGWGYEWFRKEFRRKAGISPYKYRITRRIDQARNLLFSRPDLTLEAIADRLGYCSVYEFSAQFSKYAGVPPGRYRNR